MAGKNKNKPDVTTSTPLHPFLKGLRDAGLLVLIVAAASWAVYSNKETVAPQPAPPIGMREALAKKNVIVLNVSNLPLQAEGVRIVHWNWRDTTSQWRAIDETLKLLREDDIIVIWAGPHNERVKYVRAKLQAVGISNLRIGQ